MPRLQFSPGSKSTLFQCYDLSQEFVVSKRNAAATNGGEFGNYNYCPPVKVLSVPTFWNDTVQTKAMRFSQLAQRKAPRGKTMFGNYNVPLQFDYLGNTQGQAFGTPPCKNQF